MCVCVSLSLYIQLAVAATLTLGTRHEMFFVPATCRWGGGGREGINSSTYVHLCVSVST